MTDLSKLKILVAGTARNCERTIRKEVEYLNKALRFCRDLSWFVVESDSSDATVYQLESIAKDIPSFRFSSLGKLTESLPLRTQRLAYCRNIYIQELRSNPFYADIDYLIVADLDGTNELVSEDGVKSCWTRLDWDVCTANQRGPYYDIWALRHSLWSPSDCFRQFDFLSSHGMKERFAVWAAIRSKMITIPEDSEWIEVDSAFGGLAVYRRRVIEDVSYIGVDAVGAEVCEHVALNHQIRSKGGRIFINPRLVNTDITPHSRRDPLRAQIESNCRRWLRACIRMVRPSR